MPKHLTGVRRIAGQIQANCPEHGAIGRIQQATEHGWNAVSTEARGHDDNVHGAYRTDSAWLARLRSER